MKCTCGRTWTHCRKCGSKNIYPLKFASMERSMELGYNVTVYGCRGKCGKRTDESMECEATPHFEIGSDYVAESRLDPRLLDYNTPEYEQALRARYAELIAKKGMDESKVEAVMRMEGWKLVPREPVETESTVNPVTQPKPLESISLEDIVNSISAKSKRRL